MEITKKAKFTTDVYGGKGYLPGSEIVRNWLEGQGDKLLHPRMRELKNALGNEGKLEEILSVFNVNGGNEPVIGDWMLLECSLNAQRLASTWPKFQVSKDLWRDSIKFSPVHVNFYRADRRRKLISEPEFVECYTITTKVGGRTVSFFKAYQGIRIGAEIEFTVIFPEDLCTKVEGRGKDKQIVTDAERTVECVNAVLDKMCIIGLGAYRLRFGKFEYC